jgi:predicted XRE-type DNA-binding protein
MSRVDHQIGGGNVVRDPGLSDAKVIEVKAGLALAIGELIRRRGLTQGQAAVVLGVAQPRVSALIRGHLEKFSMERLCNYLRALGCDVDIRIEEKKKRIAAGKQGRLRLRIL